MQAQICPFGERLADQAIVAPVRRPADNRGAGLHLPKTPSENNTSSMTLEYDKSIFDMIENEYVCLNRDVSVSNWQEQSFRDLKSGGWNWQQSHVWQPDHAQVLLLVLALAYAWVLALGTLVAQAEPAIRARITRGTQRLYSIFRESLRDWLDLLYARKKLYLGLFFAPDKLFT